ncbi:hypothetical protein HELRODRAFT_166768 [Helobdella robusta]|uniref:Uncharacterized protein n=1 Tax=Helobdella robusta TaxID=6412 RepID=T1EYI0_HELRO|nr:hypothetical protein HELRODRAFT_166768 [Helobdella robusta]ESO11743.1 hypothetical protein HELRODRAFT_166768 [Helobdella robusta]
MLAVVLGAIANIRERSMEMLENPHQILSETVADLHTNVAAILPRKDSLKRQIRRFRQDDIIVNGNAGSRRSLGKPIAKIFFRPKAKFVSGANSKPELSERDRMWKRLDLRLLGTHCMRLAWTSNHWNPVTAAAGTDSYPLQHLAAQQYSKKNQRVLRAVIIM